MVALSPIVAPETRAFDSLARSLSGWLQSRLPACQDLRLGAFAYPRGAGMSHETILFDADWTQAGRQMHRGLVVRIKPTRHFVYQDDLFDMQRELMRLMHGSGKVRVAEIIGDEPDPGLLGAPFFVMEQIKGNVAVSYPPYAQQGWLFDAAPADRRRMWRDAVSQLASIQLVPVADAAFLDPDGAFPDGFDQEVDRWRRFLDWVDPDGTLTLLRDGFSRLLATAPANRPGGIVWGDARLGNMMIADDFTVAAVMDWEQPSLGGALHDLGWWLYSDEVQTTARGLPRLDGMGSPQETIDVWREVAGKPTADIDWYVAFAMFKMECLGVRMTSLRGTGGRVPSGAPGTLLARRIGLAT